MDGQKSWKGAKLHNEANVEVHMPSPSQHAPVHCAVIVVVVVVVDVVVEVVVVVESSQVPHVFLQYLSRFHGR